MSELRVNKLSLISSYACENIQINHTHVNFSQEWVITFWVDTVDVSSRTFTQKEEAIASFKETCKQHLLTGTKEVVIPDAQKRKPVTTAVTVVNFFINEYIKSNRNLNIKKLQQLVYVTYGLVLKELDVLLFEDKYVISSNGPCLDFISFLTANNLECYRSKGNIMDFSFISLVNDPSAESAILDNKIVSILDRVNDFFFNRHSSKLAVIYTGLYDKWDNDSVRLGGMIDSDLIKHFFKEVTI